MYDISIVVITYNQEKTILETLESIKYQILLFGKNITIQLILADDGSKDQTRLRIEKWIDVNRGIFSDIIKAYPDTNSGICKNYAQAVRCATGEHLAVVAGDDLWPNINVIELILSCKEKEIIGGLPVSFKGSNIEKDARLYYTIASCAYYNKRKIIRRSRYSCPILNGFIIGKSLISEEVLRFSEQFDLLDDQARLVKMFELYQDFEYRYVNLPLLLYRQSSSQVTNKKGLFNSRIIKDKIKLTDYVLEHEKNPFIRMAAKYERMRTAQPDKFQKVWKFGYIQAYQDIILYKLRKKRLNRMIGEVMDLIKERNTEQYIQILVDKAKKY